MKLLPIIKLKINSENKFDEWGGTFTYKEKNVIIFIENSNEIKHVEKWRGGGKYPNPVKRQHKGGSKFWVRFFKSGGYL